MVQRVFLAGLALGPALAVLLLPISAMSSPATFTLGGAGSLVSVCASFKRRGGKATAPDAQGLLLGGRSVSGAAPMTRASRDGFAFLLSPDTNGFRSPREAAIASVLRDMMAAWGRGSVSELSDQDLEALTLLHALLQSDPAKAATLAQHFAQPAAVLDLRDAVAQSALPEAA